MSTSLVLLSWLAGCGGQSTSVSSGGALTPDFTLSASPSALTVNAGSSASMTITTAATNGFSGTVAILVSGSPSGVSVSPSSVQVIAGSQQTFTISVNSSVAAGSTSLIFTGSSGTLHHTAQATLTVATSTTLRAAIGRTKYVRTDSVTQYFGSINSSWIVFDSGTNRFFVADPYGNRIVVMDASTEAEIGVITVPGAYGIDFTPDHSLLYVGTEVGDVYTVDPVVMKVMHRYVASEIGPYGFRGLSARPMADGTVALLGSAGGIASVDGSSAFAVWNPATNAIHIYTTSYGEVSSGLLWSSIPFTLVCPGMLDIGAWTLSADRKAVVAGSIDSDGTVCVYTPGTNSSVTTGSGTFVYHLIVTPDGKSILQPSYPGKVLVYDAKTLTQTSSFAIADASSGATLMVSADSQTLYEVFGGALYAYSLATGAQTGWMPSITVEPSSGGGVVGSLGVGIQAADGTGLLAGPMEEGVGFLDTTSLRSGALGTLFSNGYLTTATGPTGGGTSTTWNGANGGTLKSVFFASNQASSTALSSTFSAVSPAGAAGPADVSSVMADGGVQILAEGFSYGPTLLEATPDYATAEGGGTGVVYGYGFGPVAYSSSNAIPSNLQMTVGGQTATITAFARNAYGLASPPFPLQAFTYTVPPSVSGTSADVTVTSSSGTATLTKSMHYLPALKQFPLIGASLAQGIYDRKRDLYYFTDTAAIQVFSRTQGAWLKPIAVPAALGGATHRLWGIALSPSGSYLAVSDEGAATLYLINPDTAAVQSFALPSQGSGVQLHPAGLVISDSAKIYYTLGVYGGTGYHGFYKLDTTTKTFKDYGVTSPGFGLNDLQLRAALTADNSRVFFNADGDVFDIDTATDKMTDANIGYCCYGDYDLTLGANQTSLEATSYLLDANQNTQSFFTLNDREALDVVYVYGTKFSPDGLLLFQPSTSGIDVFDGRLGTLRNRIVLPVALSQNFDALVSDNKDNVLVAITGTTGSGIAVVDLSSLAEPAALPYHVDEPLNGPLRLQADVIGRTPGNTASTPGRAPAGFGRPLVQVPHAFQGQLIPAERVSQTNASKSTKKVFHEP